jgi:hypothetical protein
VFIEGANSQLQELAPHPKDGGAFFMFFKICKFGDWQKDRLV